MPGLHLREEGRPTYHHPGAQQEAVDSLGDISCVDLVVVRVLILAVAGLQGIQEGHQKHSGNLRQREVGEPCPGAAELTAAAPPFFGRAIGTHRQMNLGSQPGSTTC